MAKNDTVLLDGIIDDRVSASLPSEQRDEAFEYLAFEQILKDFDLSNEEILHGSVDGAQDGGIDGFFTFVNGHLLQDPESFLWPRTHSELRVTLITCKHHETFKQAPLDALIATLAEFLDFSVDNQSLAGRYSPHLLAMRNNLKYAYRRLSPRLSSFTIDAYYASRGDVRVLGNDVRARGQQIARLAEESFGSCKSNFHFVGAKELVELHRKSPIYSLDLPYVQALANGNQYVVLTKLSDYYDFVSDNGKLRRHLFDSNVRDFMGLNRVNEDIKATLERRESPDFWWLNNGVTILATSAAKTGASLKAEGIQIVNGLQTTESIFRHFLQSQNRPDNRCVLVKVIVTNDEAVRDDIIKATNNQTDVELASLHATDKIQRDIEEILLKHGLFYERRKNFYVNQGHSLSDVVTPLYIAAGYLALILKQPHKAAILKSKFMRKTESYAALFDEHAPIEVWPKIASIFKRIDSALEHIRPKKDSDKFLKGWRYITAFCLIAENLNKFMYNSSDISQFDVTIITPICVERLQRELSHYAKSDHPNSWSQQRVWKACRAFAERRGITDVVGLIPHLAPAARINSGEQATLQDVSPQFLQAVIELMPPQPWKPGVHRTVAAQLRCDRSTLVEAVEQLIAEGVFLRQKDGVLYDLEGNVVSFDPERVDAETLTLKILA